MFIDCIKISCQNLSKINRNFRKQNFVKNGWNIIKTSHEKGKLFSNFWKLVAKSMKSMKKRPKLSKNGVEFALKIFYLQPPPPKKKRRKKKRNKKYNNNNKVSYFEIKISFMFFMNILGFETFSKNCRIIMVYPISLYPILMVHQLN